MVTSVPQLDLRPTAQSLAEWRQLEQTFQRSRQEVKKLQQQLKEVEGVARGLRLNQIRAQGATSYLQGADARQSRQVSRQIYDGTTTGRAVNSQKEQLTLARQHTNFIKQQANLARAMNMDVQKELKLVSEITDQKKLQAMQETALLRMGVMHSQNLRSQAAEAGALNATIQRRIQLLREEQRAGRFERSRSEQRERLFGDGGAHLMGVQAGLMGNYMALGAGLAAAGGTARFVADFDEALHNLQATVVITDGNMVGLRDSILDVSKGTRFLATELAEAGVNMGQAGLSAKEIQESLKGVALLATATGTDLNQSVDVMTSVLGVFNKTASQTEEIANTITQAVNDSKLSIDKMTLGLQYAGNTAAQSGVSFEELIASLGAISNAGIRSGSTMGTGLRQLMISFQKPTKAFRATLNDLGLTMADVDLHVHGLGGAMENLKKAGFNAGDAIRSFEVRAAAAFTALAGQIDTMKDLEKAFINSNAAAMANETQMDSLKNKGRQLLSTFQSLSADALQPFVVVLGDVATSLSAAVDAFSPLISALLQFGTVFVVIKGVAKLATMGMAAARGIGLIAPAAATAATASTALAGTASMLSRALGFLAGPWGIAASAAIGAVSFAMYGAARDAGGLADEIDKARTKFDKAQGNLVSVRQEYEMTGERIADLKTRAAALKGEDLSLEAAKIRQEFRQMGVVLPETVDHVDDLITALQNLRGVLAEKYLLNLGLSQDALRVLEAATKEDVATTYEDLAASSPAMRRSSEHNLSPATRRRGTTQDLLSQWHLLDQALRPENRKNTQLKEDVLFQGRTALNAAKEDLASDPYNEGLRILVERFEQFLDLYAPLVKKEMEVLDQQDQLKRGDQERTGLRVGRDNAQVGEDITLLANTSSSTFRDVQDPDRSAVEQMKLAQELFEDKKLELEAYAQAIEGISAAAEEITPGSGGFATADMGAQLAKVQSELQTGYAEVISGIQDDLEAALEELDLTSGLHLDELNKAISDEKDPKLKQGHIQLRDAYLAAAQRQREELMLAQIEGAKAVGDDAAVAEFDGKRRTSSADFRTALGKSSEEQKGIIKGEVTRDLARSKEMKTIYDADTGRQLDERQAEINKTDDLDDRLNKIESLKSWFEDRQQISMALADAINTAATAAEAGLRDTPELDRLVESRKDQEAESGKQLAAFEDQRKSTLETQRNRSIADIGKLIQSEGASFQEDMALLERQLEVLPDDQLEQKADLIKQMIERRNQKAETVTGLQDEILALIQGDTSFEMQQLEEATQKAQAEEVKALEADTRGFNDRMREAQQAAHDENIKLINQAIDQAERLMTQAKTAEDFQKHQASALILLNQKMAGSVAASVVARPMSQSEVNDAVESDRAQFQSVAQTAVDTADALGTKPNPTFVNTPGVKPPKDKKEKGGKGKKGGGRKEKSEQEKWIETSKGAVDAYQDLADRGVVKAQEAAAVIAKTTADATTRLTKVDAEVTSLYKKMQSGGLQEKEQEKLTQLLKEQSGLLDIVEASYADIGAQMISQGQYSEGFSLILKDWSTEALDFDKTLKEGLLNTLNTGLNGIASFFTGITDGTKSAKGAFADLAISVLKSVQQMLAQLLALKVMTSSIQWLNNSFGLGLPIPGMNAGGEVKQKHIRRFALGGGSNPNRDSQLIMARPGEYMLRKSAVDMIGKDTLDQLNAQGNSVVSQSRGGFEAPKQPSEQTINFYLVDERSQAQGMGPQDVLAVVTDDLARGGSTKKLIKSIQMGSL